MNRPPRMFLDVDRLQLVLGDFKSSGLMGIRNAAITSVKIQGGSDAAL